MSPLEMQTDLIKSLQDELKETRRDLAVLVLRLLGENEDTFAIETLTVMRRWKDEAFTILQGE